MLEASKELLTDGELCAVLGISLNSLQRYMRNGPPRKRRGADAGDVRTIRHISVGGTRRWVRKAVDEFIHGEL